MEQTINDAQPIAKPAGKTGLPSSADSFVEAALDFLSDEPAGSGPDEPAVEKKAKKRREPDDEQQPESDDGEPSDDLEDEDEDGDQQSEDSDDEGQADTRGSKDEPFSLKDLPKNKYIELKVDGEKLVVPLDELANGYVREQTFNRRLNKTQALANEAQGMLQKAAEIPKRVRAEVSELLGDPAQLYEFFTATEGREQVLEAVARQYAEQRRRWREQPEAKLAWQRQRDMERVAFEREQFETQKRQELETRQRAEANQRAISIFKPGWEAGLKKAGFPTPTKELYDEVLLRCQQRQTSGEAVTSEDVAVFTARAAKLLELPPASANKPKPAPQKAVVKSKPARRDEWDKLHSSQRRKDPDYFLKNLRAKDFR